MKPRLPPVLTALLEAPRPSARLAPPDIAPWRAGNALSGVWSFEGAAPGPHLCIVALTHGNEFAGAILLDRLLRAGIRPVKGRLTLIFANLDAFSRFDAEDPTASRFLEEDLNRVWDIATLEGPRRSAELRRARALRPIFDRADVILDLHSMLWPADPLLLVGGPPDAERLALAIGEPALVVADQGHLTGRRLIDYGHFAVPGSGRRGVLLEAGWHWEAETVERMAEATRRMLALTGLVPSPLAPAAPCRLARVTETITARTADFSFTRSWRGGTVIPARGTLIARDGDQEIRTPHADCMLVMPNLLPQPGQTAVRLARL
ncbi:MAG: succinylglutamate desuccinylase/aspartoacylase family protein [Roseococcus sp.]|nr:succinylglutamate desuccinylase/aspartoacylase family protein [Roseococcus sp.]